ncbi:hypothetical protein GM921_06895 [Pedobacter sp. LMG 31464]|uniref:VCBS repeat-containing protein n=1 Tax=Pedobacter planticolens TaxID=2679964 RepID=A0A923DZB4_9SPHI|nr:hypothetical protein [Pedobacter planticolens]MBB2145203.1 hypothetical protein [Pedobacter planticolens]
MRYLTLIFCLFCWQFSAAQTFTYPKLTAQGNDINSLTPTNWNVIDTAFGDLNNDKLEDLVLVLEFNNSIIEKRAYGDGETELIKEFQKPRILAVYFKDTRSGKYKFALQNNNFILRSQEGGELGEPFKNLTIQNNSLNLAFEGGSNWRWKLNYQFKYQNKDWVLIQANNIYYNITSGEMTDKLYDFVNRKMKLITGNIFARNNANEVSEETINYSQLRTLNNFKKPWTWEITKDNFL